MVRQEIIFRGSKAELMQQIYSLASILSGRASDPTGLVQNLMLRVGMTAMSLIREAFIVKSRGGTDEAGMKWEPLAEVTIVNRRQGPETKRQMRIGSRTAALTKEQKQQYRKEYRDRRVMLRAYGHSDQRASALARAQAFNVVRGAGGHIPTRRQILGGREVEILRDTGLLFNSFSPGLLNHVADARPGQVIVGTRDPKAVWHHLGTPTIPQRRLWPPVEDWPQRWWDELFEQFHEGTAELLVMLMG